MQLLKKNWELLLCLGSISTVKGKASRQSHRCCSNPTSPLIVSVLLKMKKNSQRWQLHAYIECRNTIHILLWRSSKTNPMMKLDINFRIKSVYFHRHHKSTHSIVYMYIWCISKYQYWISMNWIPVYIPSFGGSYID